MLSGALRVRHGTSSSPEQLVVRSDAAPRARCRTCRCLIAAAGVLGLVPDFRGKLVEGPLAEADRGLVVVPRAASLILAAFAPGPPRAVVDRRSTSLAIAAQFGTDFAQTVHPQPLLDRAASHESSPAASRRDARRTAFSTPIALVATLAAYEEPLVLLAVIAPLVWLLDNFSKDRAARYASALELNRAYRGTVMLLSDVLEFEDEYTAQHSRSVVDLVNAVADELGIAPDERQELEFAAMLHDVGKISIPKDILHKPAALTEQEFEVIKHHTIEGQFMLDRVGGLLGRVGEVVRSCHERWDGRGYPDGLAGEEIPDRRSDRLRLRRVQRDDDRPSLPRGDVVARRPSPSCVANYGSAVRSEDRRRAHEGRRARRTGCRSRASRASAPCSPGAPVPQSAGDRQLVHRWAARQPAAPPRRGARRCVDRAHTSRAPCAREQQAPSSRRTRRQSPPAARNAAANAQALRPSRTPNVRAISAVVDESSGSAAARRRAACRCRSRPGRRRARRHANRWRDPARDETRAHYSERQPRKRRFSTAACPPRDPDRRPATKPSP